MSNEDLRLQIRQMQQEIAGIQEGIAAANSPSVTPSSRRVTSQNLISRTRSLIHDAVSSTSVNTSESSIRHTPNHPNRIISGRGKKRKAVEKITTHEVQVLHPPDNIDEIEPSITEERICIKEVLIDLQSNFCEEEIRLRIVQACKSLLPFLRVGDFDFVKRIKNRICTPVVDAEFKYDY